jgi:hypothetical protein
MKKKLMCLVLLVVALSGFAFQSVGAQEGANCVDLTAINAALAEAQTASQGGDTDAALSALGQARAAIDGVQANCITGESAPTTSLPAGCQYLFDATVRAGTNAGLNLHGLLMLNKDSDTVASGLLVPSEGGTDAAALIPVTAMIDGMSVTLTFDLPGDQQIVGIGAMEAPVENCIGTMDGDFTGPAADDTGDWLTGAALSSCISSRIRGCIAQFGANGSAACGADGVGLCQAASN